VEALEGRVEKEAQGEPVAQGGLEALVVVEAREGQVEQEAQWEPVAQGGREALERTAGRPLRAAR